MTTLEPEVVTLGEALVVLLASTGVPLARAVGFERQVAGAEVNVATGLARLGHRVSFVGRVGTDAFGAVVRGELRREGVDVTALSDDPDAPTGVLVRDCPTGRPVQVAYYRAGSAGSRLTAADVDPASVGGARLLHLTGITPVLSGSAAQACTAALRAARESGVPVSFDPNLRRRLAAPSRAREVLAPLMEQADVVLAGLDEALALTGAASGEDAAAWFLARRASLVVFKDGPRGSWGTDGTETVRLPAPAVPVVDPVGAGDAYAAGFLSGWLRGAGLERAMVEASAVAGLVVQSAGDTPGLPDAATRDAVLAAAGDVDR